MMEGGDEEPEVSRVGTELGGTEEILCCVGAAHTHTHTHTHTQTNNSATVVQT